jgi:uncharacterized protein
VNVLVLADTHVPGHARALPASLDRHLAWAEVILHAGDLTAPELLDQLAAHAPVHAVAGNMDGADLRERGVGERLELELGGVPVAMVHDAGARHGREQRLRRWFPAATVVVFGHSHDPVCDWHEGRLLLNPGSPTWKRRAPHPTVAKIAIEHDHLHAELIPV